ncbi:MAG: cytochrome d ubiquinol oxidase subunit II [Myxococcales bacterium]|nr:cytochrome d ubiquinol oxidase subunit II [Myxococcales bacterium]MCB9644806.1 cytochrome d ubiquinol oxidase subunit II [Myxococcales bacterium]
MSVELVVAAVILVALVVYSLTGGADFGGGFWDFFARGPRAEAQRSLIADAIGPIWEANHVWLIVVIVLLFADFPKAFAAISTALHIPLTLMLLGIVLRGSAFVFRAYDDPDVAQKRWSLIFSVSSIVTPWMLGITLGAVASGSIRMDAATGRVKTDFISSWLAPFPIALGLFVVALFAYLAAIYLILETDDPALKEDFRLRAIAAGIAVGGLAFVCLLLAEVGAPSLREGLSRRWWSLSFQIATGTVSVGALAAVWVRIYPLARILAGAQVALIISGWAFSHFPYILVPDLTFAQAAAPASVLRMTLWVLGIGAVVLLPSFWYLYSIFKGRQITR